MRKTALYMKSSSERVSDMKEFRSERSQMCFGRNSQKKRVMENAKKHFFSLICQ